MCVFELSLQPLEVTGDVMLWSLMPGVLWTFFIPCFIQSEQQAPNGEWFCSLEESKPLEAKFTLSKNVFLPPHSLLLSSNWNHFYNDWANGHVETSPVFYRHICSHLKTLISFTFQDTSDYFHCIWIANIQSERGRKSVYDEMKNSFLLQKCKSDDCGAYLSVTICCIVLQLVCGG